MNELELLIENELAKFNQIESGAWAGYYRAVDPAQKKLDAAWTTCNLNEEADQLDQDRVQAAQAELDRQKQTALVELKRIVDPARKKCNRKIRAAQARLARAQARRLIGGVNG